MHSSSLLSVVALAATVLGAPSGHVEKRAQTVYLAGDSTMARASGVTTGTYYYSSSHQDARTNNLHQAGVSSSHTRSPSP
jgi:hypothetical protein